MYGKDHKFRSMEDAIVYVRGLNLKSMKEWKQWCTKPDMPSDIPIAPDQYYRNLGWQGFSHWLGTTKAAKPSGSSGTPAKTPGNYRPFDEAQVRLLGVAFAFFSRLPWRPKTS